jgi:preprotein translocase subunit SecE
MNAKAEETQGSSFLDYLKLGLAVLVLAGTVVGLNWFVETSGAVRVIGTVFGIIVALFIAAFTAPGRAAREFVAESQFELRKVIWPTRQETLQTTLVIIVVVIIISIVLWLMDLMLGAVILQWLLKPG